MPRPPNTPPSAQADAAPQLDSYAERILRAARTLLGTQGLRRTSLGDIAREAGVSEATLYRRFPGRDDLLRTLLSREFTGFIARVDAQISAIEDPEDRLVTGFLIFARALRSHELVQRLLVTDPDRVLPLLTTHGAAALDLGRRYVLTQLRWAAQAGARLTADPEHIAEILARFAQSLLLTPDTVLPMEDDEQLVHLARSTLARMVFVHDDSRRARE